MIWESVVNKVSTLLGLQTSYHILTEAGYEVVFASLEGGEVPINLIKHESSFQNKTYNRFF